MVEEMSSIMLSLSALVVGRIRSVRIKGNEVELNTEEKVAEMLKACLLTLECLFNCNNHFQNVVEPTIRRVFEYSLGVIPFSPTEQCIGSLKALAETWNLVLEKLHGHSEPDYWKLGEWISQKAIVSDWVFKVYFLGCDNDKAFISTRPELHPSLSLLKDKAASRTHPITQFTTLCSWSSTRAQPSRLTNSCRSTSRQLVQL